MGPRASNRSRSSRSRLFANTNKETRGVKDENSSTASSPAVSGLFSRSRRTSISPSPNSISHTNSRSPSVSGSTSIAPVSTSASAQPGSAALHINDSTKPSVILSRILREIDLSYDKNVGMLNGDMVFVNNLNSLNLQTLLNLKNLILGLSKNLENISREDATNSLLIKQKLLENFNINNFNATDLQHVEKIGKSASNYGITDKIKSEILKSSNLNPDQPQRKVKREREDTVPSSINSNNNSHSKRSRRESIKDDISSLKSEVEEEDTSLMGAKHKSVANEDNEADGYELKSRIDSAKKGPPGMSASGSGTTVSAAPVSESATNGSSRQSSTPLNDGEDDKEVEGDSNNIASINNDNENGDDDDLGVDGPLAKKPRLDLANSNNDKDSSITPKREPDDQPRIPVDKPTHFDVSKFLQTTEKLDLFTPNKDLEKAKDPEYLKKWYGVLTYPTDYLRSYLTGDIPDIDFNQQKEIKNKINFNNFLSYLDHYYRPFDDEDLIFLKKKYIYSSHLDAFYANNFNTAGSSSSANGSNVSGGNAASLSNKYGRSPLAASSTTNSNGVGVSTHASNGSKNDIDAISSYNPKIHPFIIPKLGKLYTKVWAEEDGILTTSATNNSSSTAANANGKLGPPSVAGLSQQDSIKDQLMPKNSSTNLNDAILETDGVSCGPLVNRLLSALIRNDVDDNAAASDDNNNNNINDNNKDDNDEKMAEKDDDNDDSFDRKEESASASTVGGAGGTTGNANNAETAAKNEDNIFFTEYSVSKASNFKYDYMTLEERLKRELKFVGVFLNYKNEVDASKKKFANAGGGNADKSLLNQDEDILNENFEETWILNKQDDEICRELRSLQRQLKVVNLKNNLRKRALFKKVYEEISFREFYNILENLNKQIDQYYLKKQKILVRHHKKHKKAAAASASGASSTHHHEDTPGAGGGSGSLSHQQVIDKTLNSLIEKRSKWIEKIGPLFNYNSNIQLREYPETSVFNPRINEIQEDNFEEFYDIYNDFYTDEDEDEDDDDKEGEVGGGVGEGASRNTGVGSSGKYVMNSNSHDGLLLADGIKIKKGDLKLDDDEDEFDKKLKAVKVGQKPGGVSV